MTPSERPNYATPRNLARYALEGFVLFPVVALIILLLVPAPIGDRIVMLFMVVLIGSIMLLIEFLVLVRREEQSADLTQPRPGSRRAQRLARTADDTERGRATGVDD